ncbi:hypothetical protein ACLKA7_016615 [Drosophila subpalustris]
MRQAARELYFQPNLKILRQLRLKRRQQRALAAHKLRCTSNAKDLDQLDTFHRAIRPYLCLAQIFGMLPLANVLSPNPQNVKFQLRSSGMCFSVLFLLLGSLKTTRIAAKIYQGGINSRNMVSLVFFISSLIICIKFICFARNWHRLILPWNEIDIIMLFPPYAPTKRSLRRKLLITGCLLGCLTLIDHCLYYASSYYNYHMQIIHCPTNITEIDFSGYMKREFADIFEILPYNPVLMFYAFQVPDALWLELRKHHILLCELMELVDANLSGIVFLSCLNNVYFICNRLLTIFTKLRYPINYAYYWFGLLYLLGRTCAVFLCASRIHEFSLLPLEVLYMVPSDNWTEEVQRFTHQLTSQYIALSGFRLFFLTRKSFFGMMSTLVYYEFMLLQMDAKAHKEELPDLCA